ncbi:LOW QUALITY PROTEIN: hypothetical protein MC885_012278 [Smutsia gigantea]|nr:LOW QUALITY PROTEIN: hypothetical protein MC885_012278 [Smutsia gigantea]
MNRRRNRTKFTEDQLKILVSAFNQKPYPATKRKLALEFNTEESRIQIWFQNRRARYQPQKGSEPEKGLEPSQDQDGAEEEIQSRNDRWRQTSYPSSQLHTLIEAFMKNPYPGADSREQLAKEIGVPESRVQKKVECERERRIRRQWWDANHHALVWFQNRRSRFHVQRKREADETLERSQDRGQEALEDGRAPETTQNGPNVPGDCPVSLESEQGLEKDIQTGHIHGGHEHSVTFVVHNRVSEEGPKCNIDTMSEGPARKPTSILFPLAE